MYMSIHIPKPNRCLLQLLLHVAAVVVVVVVQLHLMCRFCFCLFVQPALRSSYKLLYVPIPNQCHMLPSG